ncbi:MAG: ThiF family adenylyltransferase [Desulfobacteraceae bacterium]|nr:ThiF family adenylyltransferase [Desulfobacteraceae bacterium]
MRDLAADIESTWQSRKNHTGVTVKTISDRELNAIGKKHRRPVREVCVACLKMGVTPLRYLRNSPAITLMDQIILAESEVAIAGAGGLGGHVILLLARLGIGRLLVFDSDTFDETNLNRQALCFSNNIDTFKPEEAARQCALINPAVEVSAHIMAIADPCQKSWFRNTDVMVDALDSAEDRLFLAKLSRELGIPLIHGAVAGFEGRVMTVFPGDKGMETLYRSKAADGPDSSLEPAAENLLGTPALAPALIAAFQVMAVLNVLLKRGPIPNNSLLHLDLATASINAFTL